MILRQCSIRQHVENYEEEPKKIEIFPRKTWKKLEENISKVKCKQVDLDVLDNMIFLSH